MDGNRFDRITRQLAEGVSRREVLRKLGGGVLGGTLAVAGLRRTGAVPAGKVGICHRTGSASNPLVFITVSENAATAHAAHGDDVGVDLLTDVNNCGTCGNVCPGDVCNTPVCQDGVCGTTPVICDDESACTADSCDVAQGGCVFTPITCDDENACTTDTCEPATGCVFTNNTDACTTEDGESGICADGACVPICTGLPTGTACGGADGCSCATEVPTGAPVCITFEGGCDFPCTDTTGCAAGTICVDDNICGFTHCHPPCPSGALLRSSQQLPTDHGR